MHSLVGVSVVIDLSSGSGSVCSLIFLSRCGKKRSPVGVAMFLVHPFDVVRCLDQGHI